MIARHLNDIELVDFAEGRLAPARAAHATTCAECASRAADLRDLLERTIEPAVPEPSPLFWEHLSSRVSEAIDREPSSRSRDRERFLLAPAWAWAAAAACATVVAGAALWRAAQTIDPADTPGGVASSEIVMPVADQNSESWSEDIDADGAWALVQAVAEDVDWEEANAAGISARPQSADHVIPQLSNAERSELARLIEEELHRNGA